MTGGGLSPGELDSTAPNGMASFGPDALSRLRLPGGQPQAPVSYPAAPTTGEPFQPQASISKRVSASTTPAPDANPVYGVPGSGVQRNPPSRSTPDATGSGVRGYTNRAPTTDETPQAMAQRLRNENKELRKLLDEMKHLLQEASDSEQQYANREQEFQAAIAERQRQVDELSTQMHAIEEQIASGALAPQQPVTVPKNRTELEEWADELERDSAKLAQERKKMDSERQQLREDEESLEKQMRGMEVAMARERALMARQETELKRLSAEIQHELEIMQRGDATLRDQMQKFQRRAQDVLQGKVGGNSQQQPPANPGRR